ncbi:Fic family protein [Blastopirellula marina]|uniref:Fic family protein n=1 Tax=Blastopirellula marina TaxID=124 RepID=A0A2S8GM23_9BACT|nr:Fic family protein [Blastopirellula marina]PQO45371.1 Fic family protein [Blastopirellula marina]
MDSKLFDKHSPGKLISVPEAGAAFIPDPLPASFQFDPSLWPLLADARESVSLLEGIGRTLPNPGILLRPLEDREALQSSRLEGTYITAKEFLIFDLDSDIKPDRVDDWREVHNYRRALKHGQDSPLPISQRLILELHQILMAGIPRADMTPGKFRTHQVAIGSNKRFVPPPPTVLKDCLNSFESYVHDTPPFHALIHCFLCHYQFETIHPFHDGNGRVGRLLLALMLQQRCGLSRPWLYLSDILERNREEYCARLFNVSANGDWNGWLEFCLKATIVQAKETIDRCDQLQKIRESIRQKVSEGSGAVRLHSIIDRLFSSPFVRVVELTHLLGVSFPTARSDCNRLEELGILTQLPNLSPITYYCREIFNVAYNKIGDDDSE